MISDLFRKPAQLIHDQRCVIVHIHIFKNAGTTFDWALKRNFGKAFIDHRDDDARKKGGAEYLLNYINAHSDLAAFSSHHIRIPLPEDDTATFLPALFIRHPVLRAQSVYTYERHQRSATPGAQHAKKLDFEKYIEWRMQKGVGRTIRNSQTIICAKLLAPGRPFNLTRAKTFLELCPLMGIVERFDESMVVFEHHLQSYFQGLDLSYRRQNRGRDENKDQPKSINARASAILNTMGAQKELFLESNKNDQMLYRFANKLLDERIQSIEDFGAHLTEFQERKARLQRTLLG